MQFLMSSLIERSLRETSHMYATCRSESEADSGADIFPQERNNNLGSDQWHHKMTFRGFNYKFV